ncbi:D-alanyl-D-alanine carboxypeptidase family protein [Nonomuraea sp. MCN248]|uniref:D-alanyl-D-alanine carboxypeptidase family protein n=1 Tax=Nonomuraea corallina TaxID=2989783 RepID=A0ABT4S437_9ACTN|nr:D-alanyl-D-alanine carboxypeptidase family protein [Nonomuraea corallina]MDA0631915.1 D-alanyl-D-alanine carboxypeptidase family protein [Nonomuraea corallina]
MTMASLASVPVAGHAQAAEQTGQRAQRAVTQATSGAGAETGDPKNLTELRKEAQRSAQELEDATRALEKRRSEFAGAEKELKEKLRALEVAERQLAQVRQPVSRLAEMLYQQPVGADGAASFMAGDSDSDTLRTLAMVNHMVTVRQHAVEETSTLTLHTQRLAAEAQEMRAANLLAEAQMAAEIDLLRKKSDKVVKSLTQALVKLGIKIDKVEKAALGCNPLRAATANDYPNGLIPTSMLCPLQQKGHSLRADAAIAFVSLNEAYRRQFGRPICVTDAYRNLAEQQSIYYRRPGFAAVPGKSNHGLGLAVDLCGGVERFRSAEFNWLEKYGKKYGWYHPDWAYRSPFEPWHWEYDPKIDSVV